MTNNFVCLLSILKESFRDIFVTHCRKLPPPPKKSAWNKHCGSTSRPVPPVSVIQFMCCERGFRRKFGEIRAHHHNELYAHNGTTNERMNATKHRSYPRCHATLTSTLLSFMLGACAMLNENTLGRLAVL